MRRQIFLILCLQASAVTKTIQFWLTNILMSMHEGAHLPDQRTANYYFYLISDWFTSLIHKQSTEKISICQHGSTASLEAGNHGWGNF